MCYIRHVKYMTFLLACKWIIPFSLIIGVLGLYVWKPGLKFFIDNSSASVKCEGFFFTDDNEEGEGGKPYFDKKNPLL